MYKSLLLLLISFPVLSSTSQIGLVECHDKSQLGIDGGIIEGEFCTYTIKNLANVGELSRKVEQALFNGESLIEPDGILETFGDNNQTLIFSHQRAEILQQMKLMIPMMDSKENFAPNDVVRINADIYEVNETGLSNLGASITNLRVGSGINDGLDNIREVTASSEGLGIDLRAGIYEISGKLAAEKTKGNLNRITQIKTESYNLHKANYSDITTIYQAPGAGTSIHPEEEGIKIKAKVSINSRNRNLVVLKDFDLYYGVANGDGTINKLNIPKQRLVLKEGVLFPLVSSKTTGTQSSRTSGIFNFNRSSTQQNKKLLVYLSVDIMTWDEFVGEMSISKRAKVQTKFTKAQIKELPTECPTTRDLLSALEVNAVRGGEGVPTLSFNLDKSMACKKNIKKRIYVRTTGGGIGNRENIHLLRIEELMHRPVQITGIQDYFWNLTWINFTVGINIFNKSNTRVLHNLIYSRTENYDISENFWIE
jgi:hypothetical protein